eukprot:TRINITY_DN50082_c0_g1_i1.p1 TRINITY_DN50082_c0_g1~~TRINITY_DN50082_c0_g1_i1.p1  ORF type:complete len:538 (+),score=135.61 TRINITY_DN50082_c0_g1_i1:88-1614(+)
MEGHNAPEAVGLAAAAGYGTLHSLPQPPRPLARPRYRPAAVAAVFAVAGVAAVALWGSSARRGAPRGRHGQQQALVSRHAVPLDPGSGGGGTALGRTRSRTLHVNGTSVTLNMLAAMTYTTVSIGTPPVELRVMVDTGSSTLIVPGKACGNCKFRCPGCVYDAAQSSTSVVHSCGSAVCKSIWADADPCTRPGVDLFAPDCVGLIRYADKSRLVFNVVDDTVRIGALSSTVTFGSMVLESSHFAGSQVDGILGLAGRQLNLQFARTRTALGRMVQTYGLPDVFGVYVGDQAVPGSGVFTLGYLDPTRYVGPMYWLSEVSEPGSFYTVAPLALHAGGVQIATGGFGRTIVDTGTTVIALPDGIYNELQKALLGAFPGTDDLWKGYCFSSLDIAAWPTLRFAFQNITGGVAVAVVPPEVYFLRSEPTPGGQVFHCLGVRQAPMPDLTILGDAFLGAFYVGFDRERGRIGIAPAAVLGAARRGVEVHNAARPAAVGAAVPLAAAFAAALAQ